MSAEKDGNEEELKFTVALRPRHKLIMESFKIVEGSQKQVVWKALEMYAKKYSSAIPGLYKKVNQEVQQDIQDALAQRQREEQKRIEAIQAKNELPDRHQQENLFWEDYDLVKAATELWKAGAKGSDVPFLLLDSYPHPFDIKEVEEIVKELDLTLQEAPHG